MKKNLELDLTLEELEERLFQAEAITELWEEFGLTFDTTQLEYIANYLLEKTSRQERQAYRVLTQAEFDKKNRQTTNISIYQDSNDSSTSEGISNIIDIVLKPKNDYINMDWKVTYDDVMEDSAMGEVLKQYRNIRLRVMKLQRNGKLDVKTYRNLMSNINDDMIMTKKIFKGATEPKNSYYYLGDVIDWDAIDYTNESHIEAILKTLNLKGDIVPDDTLGLIVLDIKIFIDKMKKKGLLTNEDETIIDMTNEGCTLKQISKKIGIQESGVRKRFKKICKKIAQFNSRTIK